MADDDRDEEFIEEEENLDDGLEQNLLLLINGTVQSVLSFGFFFNLVLLTMS